MVEIKKITYTDSLRQGTDKINSNFDTVVDEIKAVDDRVDTIIVGGGPDKDPELVDIRNLDPSYTPQREINVAGDVTRDMQAQFAAHKADLVKESMVVLIPSDYPTLQEAIDALSNKFPAKDVMIELRMESGFQPSSGISITYRDCSQFRITSEDPVVTVANDFAGDFIRAEYYARAPILATIVDMNDKGSDGYHISQQSTGFVEQNCGIRNAGMRGLYVNEASIVQARRSEFTGCNERNVWITRGSILSADTSNFSANKGGDNAVYVSRGSTAYISYSTITNAFKNAISGVRSVIICEQCDVSGANGDGLNVSICRVSAKFMVAKNCTGNGFTILDASNVDVRESDCSGCLGHGLYVNRSSIVNALGLIAMDCGGNGVFASEAATVNARNATITGNSTYDVRVIGGSFINVQNATVGTFSQGRNVMTSNGAIFVDGGSEIGLVSETKQEKKYELTYLDLATGFSSGSRIRLRFKLGDTRVPYMFYVNFAGNPLSDVAGRWAVAEKIFVLNINGDGSSLINSSSESRFLKGFVDSEVTMTATGSGSFVDLTLNYPVALTASINRWGLSVRVLRGGGDCTLTEAVIEAIP